jgi:hypothetical protein
MLYAGNKKLKSEFMAHCHRELTHAQLEIIFDNELVATYKHGMVINCCDNLLRRFYPRFFIHSADYPEK